MEWSVAAARDGQAPRQLPPGFRFHPTDEELVVQYLRRKALSRPLPAAVIPVVHDVATLDPWDLPGAGEGEAYFFSLRRGAPATDGGGRRRRARSGYWKVTGKAKPVFLQGSGCGGKRFLVGVKTALTFHRGEPSRGAALSSSSRTAWVMHEYRLAVPAEQRKDATHQGRAVPPGPGEWVVCRVFLKNSSTRRPNRDAAGETPANLASSAAPPRDQGTGRLRLLLSSSPQASSSSCVTGVTEISDQDEVSSGQR
ncbi:hypothetical protein PR202_gb27547 [Eleusine coracana subsp. coracana]|uniref:NAC domain-containing protein n=1 Tax=Eleusine coracana subsp. coracana TaxID=191504 RepID=A0AAV5FVM4_ELECO|nr:hypothetical protein QOZ80_6AG0541150 [Eleusine coracana subsp. coracana]GJN38500.1 hypothetical protein PR202_gb27547 [Eleusine coracana subsp. coracana]